MAPRHPHPSLLHRRGADHPPHLGLTSPSSMPSSPSLRCQGFAAENSDTRTSISPAASSRLRRRQGDAPPSSGEGSSSRSAATRPCPAFCFDDVEGVHPPRHSQAPLIHSDEVRELCHIETTAKGDSTSSSPRSRDIATAGPAAGLDGLAGDNADHVSFDAQASLLLPFHSPTALTSTPAAAFNRRRPRHGPPSAYRASPWLAVNNGLTASLGRELPSALADSISGVAAPSIDGRGTATSAAAFPHRQLAPPPFSPCSGEELQQQLQREPRRAPFSRQ